MTSLKRIYLLITRITILAIFASFPSLAISNTKVGIQFIADSKEDTFWVIESDRSWAYRVINEVNQYNKNTGVPIEFYITGVKYLDGYIKTLGNTDWLGRTTLNKTDVIEDIENGWLGYMFTNRESEAVDYNVYYVRDSIKSGDTSLCGWAGEVPQSDWQIRTLAEREKNYVFMKRSCDSETLAHELGHLMGLAHGNAVADCKNSQAHAYSIKNYAKGYAGPSYYCSGEKVKSNFSTIMVGNYGQNTVPLFSNSGKRRSDCDGNKLCGNGSYGNASRLLTHYARAYSLYSYPVNLQKLTYKPFNSWYNCIQRSGSGVKLERCNNINDQQWGKDLHGYLRSKNDPLICLSARNNSIAHGSVLEAKECQYGNKQRFFVYENTIRPLSNIELCVTIPNNDYTSGKQLKLQNCTGTYGQMWAYQ